MSASEIIKELPKLSEAERRAVLNKLRELAVRNEDVRLCEQAADKQAAELDRLEEPAYGFSAREMRKIAQNLHAKAKEEIRSGRGSEFRGSIEEAL